MKNQQTVKASFCLHGFLPLALLLESITTVVKGIKCHGGHSCRAIFCSEALHVSKEYREDLEESEKPQCLEPGMWKDIHLEMHRIRTAMMWLWDM